MSDTDADLVNSWLVIHSIRQTKPGPEFSWNVAEARIQPDDCDETVPLTLPEELFTSIPRMSDTGSDPELQCIAAWLNHWDVDYAISDGHQIEIGLSDCDRFCPCWQDSEPNRDIILAHWTIPDSIWPRSMSRSHFSSRSRFGKMKDRLCSQNNWCWQ
jgi:arylamine N-acetyltransferase